MVQNETNASVEDADAARAISEATGKSVFWIAVFLVGSFGTAIVARLLEFSALSTMIAMMASMLLIIPMIRSLKQVARAKGEFSDAMQRYTDRTLIWTFSYVGAIALSVFLYHRFELPNVMLWFVAILPSLPIIYFVWAVGRYLIDEKDEYVRMRQVNAAITATGFLLILATFWGFLGSFGLVPHVPTWAAVPVWASGLIIGHILNWVRGI